MKSNECNYQVRMDQSQLVEVLADGLCHHCRISVKDLLEKGEILEFCAEEYAFDIESGQQFLVPIALCPSCHVQHHRDAKGKHNPCQIKARLSRECPD